MYNNIIGDAVRRIFIEKIWRWEKNSLFSKKLRKQTLLCGSKWCKKDCWIALRFLMLLKNSLWLMEWLKTKKLTGKTCRQTNLLSSFMRRIFRRPKIHHSLLCTDACSHLNDKSISLNLGFRCRVLLQFSLNVHQLRSPYSATEDLF